MGNLLFSSAPEPMKLVLLGLDAAGKTSVLYKLNDQLNGSKKNVIETIPTIGFNIETLHIHGLVFTAWDVGGRSKIRALWRHYFQGTDAIVYVVDSNDPDRLEQARDELHHTLNEEELAGIPLLIFCNKQDLPNALSPTQLVDRLDVRSETMNRHWRAVGCIANHGEGLYEGIQWLSKTIKLEKLQKEETPLSLSKRIVAPGKRDLENVVSRYSKTPEVTLVGLEETGESKTVETERAQKVTTSQSHKKTAKAERVNTIGKEEAPASAEKPDTKSKQDLVSLLGYDPSDIKTNLTLQHFRGIQQGTQCPFAKAAKLWGGKSDTKDIIENPTADEANVAALVEFVRRSNAGEHLDGFCIELPPSGAATPEELGVTVRRTMTALSDKDPAAEGAMRVKYIGSRGWRFRFAKADFFVTTFAPCYPASSSRYAFGTGRAFMLLQPELSFLRHDLPVDTSVTSDPPKTIRDKTRLAFRDAGRKYHIPDTTKYPQAEHIVKPTHDDGKTVIRWWVDNGEAKIEEVEQQ